MVALRVLVVDSNLVVRRGLMSMLEAGGHLVAGEATDAPSAVRLVQTLRPDMVLLDVRMPGQSGMELLASLVSHTRVLIVTGVDSPEVIDQALRAGATGYLVYGQFTSEELLDAVAATAAGRPKLSPVAVEALVANLRSGRVRPTRSATTTAAHGLSRREAEIMEHVVRGQGNAQIARTLYLSEKTVKNHINHINAKLGTRNRAEAIACWLGLAGPAEQAGPGQRPVPVVRHLGRPDHRLS
ncbi:response regulator [Micromonospora echinofusca]|uniref:Response regulator n=1 Tax=Micromonospora echinofusca TaxID=47858 RepID=A0ABS3VWS6_MICEH|nr:response regulator [Micromonospora echinofusca]